ncbi:mesoderm induction early response protein 1-like [Planococcus citri]|uniref:mesoderm induction early response protein 1-like n=1 Tax=Planococcus citri TaxID=170843 RepID=UPI0031F76C0E
MDYENDDDTSDELELDNYYELPKLPTTFSYNSRKTDTKNESNSTIGLPLRKSIMVGSSYQATIPELIKKPPYADKKKPYSGEDKLLWSPFKINDKEVEKYLSNVHKINYEKARGITAIPRGTHTRDDEQALYTLHQSGYNIDKTLQKIKGAPVNTDTSSYWSEEECKSFESGIRIYGKEFFLIHTNKVKSRTVGELVQFYYLWKKTERHDVFANRAKLEKKKYSLHPGVTFLEDHDENNSYKDGTFTNIQCLIYGDAKKFHRGTDLTSHGYYDNNSAGENKSKSTWNNHLTSGNSHV